MGNGPLTSTQQIDAIGTDCERVDTFGETVEGVGKFEALFRVLRGENN